MAVIDHKRGVVVVRIVYDGAPASGKSATLQALREALHTPGEVYAAEAYADGGTQYFDWLDYQGGRFEGFPLMCQIISAPGRPSLHARRRILLESADAVVFILNSRASAVASALEYFTQMRQSVEKHTPPVRFTVQADQQDKDDAVPMDMLQLMLPPDVRIMPASLARKEGLREVFVSAVGQAVERLREARAANLNVEGDSLADTPAALLSSMQAQMLEVSSHDVVLEKVLSAETSEKLDEEVFQDTREDISTISDTPPLPGTDTPALHVFPAEAGIAALEKLAARGYTPQRLEDGSWLVKDMQEGCYCYSHVAWEYPSHAQALRALRGQIQLHTRYSAVLANKRYLALAKSAAGWRLWQLSWNGRTLLDEFQAAHEMGENAALADKVLYCADNAYKVLNALEPHIPGLALTLESIGVENDTPVYLGALQENAGDGAETLENIEVKKHLQMILAAPFAELLQQRQIEPVEIMENIQSFEAQHPEVLSALADLCSPNV